MRKIALPEESFSGKWIIGSHIEGYGEYPLDFCFGRETIKKGEGSYRLTSLVSIYLISKGEGEFHRRINTFKVGRLIEDIVDEHKLHAGMVVVVSPDLRHFISASEDLAITVIRTQAPKFTDYNLLITEGVGGKWPLAADIYPIQYGHTLDEFFDPEKNLPHYHNHTYEGYLPLQGAATLSYRSIDNSLLKETVLEPGYFYFVSPGEIHAITSIEKSPLELDLFNIRKPTIDKQRASLISTVRLFGGKVIEI